MKKTPVDWFTDNLSYKLVALVIALILWFTILGRRDFVYTKNIDLEFQLKPGFTLHTQTSDHVKVRVSGPRSALKNFIEKSTNVLQVDLTYKGAGVTEVDVPVSRIEVPVGVKILSIRPNVIRLEIAEEVSKAE